VDAVIRFTTVDLRFKHPVARMDDHVKRVAVRRNLHNGARSAIPRSCRQLALTNSIRCLISLRHIKPQESARKQRRAAYASQIGYFFAAILIGNQSCRGHLLSAARFALHDREPPPL
jgi:hypothetical protein